jgi:lysophospholipase L1-like esterase
MRTSLSRSFGSQTLRAILATTSVLALGTLFAACSSSSSGNNTDQDAGPGTDGSTQDKDGGQIIGKDSGPGVQDSGGNDSGASQDAGPPAPRYVGRTSVNGTDVTCNWSGCRAMAKFHGTAASISIGGSLGSSNYDVIVDGTITKQIVVNPANAANPFVLATGLPNADHTVEIYKRSESQDGIETYHGFTFPNGGVLLPPPLPAKHLIEFVGDSITAGFGVEGAPANCDAFPLIDTLTNVRKSFAGVTAASLGADAIFIAYSGKGVTRNYDSVNDTVLMFGNADLTKDLYGMTKSDDGAQTWGFKPQPDAVVIALGADDFNNPGVGAPPTQVQFQTAYQAMIVKVRAKNPNAYIFAMYSPGIQDLGAPNDGLTICKAAIPAAVTALKDAKVFYVDNIPNAGMGDGTGCLTHPNIAYHANAATSLTGFIKTKTGW